jgi:hypothetical protein
MLAGFFYLWLISCSKHSFTLINLIILCIFIFFFIIIINMSARVNLYVPRLILQALKYGCSFSVRFGFYIKKKLKTETGSNRPVSVRFGFFRKKLVQNGLARFFLFGSVFFRFRFGSVFLVSGL